MDVLTTYKLKFHPDDERDTEIYHHPRALQEGDVIKPDTQAKWFRVVGLAHTREGREARLAEGGSSEAEAHNPKLTRA